MTQTADPQPPVPAIALAPELAPSPEKGWARRAQAAIDERLGIDALRYPVPAHANKVGYSLGGLTAFSLLILIVTSVYLGRFVRGVHYWAAEAMYVLAILHLLRVYFTASYKRPREANWLIGVGMFALTIGALFTGTVLKWDQEGFEALSHNVEIGRLLGGLGVAHVSIIPMLILGLLVLHTLLIKRHKISPAPANPDATGEPVGPFTHHLSRIATLGVILLGGLSILAVVFPPGVGPTPVEGIEVTKPPWMYWWMFTLENWIGLAGILWGTVALFALLVALPFIDRNPRRYWRQRPVAMVLGVLVLAALIVFSILEGITTPVEHLGGM